MGNLSRLSIITLTLVLLSACAPEKHSAPGTADQTTVTPVVAPEAPAAPVDAGPVCETYDSCTYSTGFSRAPIYHCVENTLQAADHPEIDPRYFAGKACLTLREDYHQEQRLCGPPWAPAPCLLSIQGPGPQAIPELNL